ncbi:hypothetical protein HIM_09845 [Hirsutella minnesotensis 3608]|uniref:Protein kinase domain-containing protein n=1 Tax=Hirsutella minnesotensis 3608 TaxID=1043627 RepID=A0A0F7ZGE7_9HYPO|nr:hypothetical protein HIM_09845 [Hirsutella minnesotensis 3608]
MNADSIFFLDAPETDTCYTRKYAFEPHGISDDGQVADFCGTDVGHRGTVCVRTFSGPAASKKVRALSQVRHRSFVDVLAIVWHCDDDDESPANRKARVIFEFMPLFAIDVCALGYDYLNQLRLAAILGQVLQGVAFLEAAGLTHMKFNNTHVVVDLNGRVKICE